MAGSEILDRHADSACWVAIEITRRDHSTAIRVRCPYILSRDPYLSFVVPGIACDGTCTITATKLSVVAKNLFAGLKHFGKLNPEKPGPTYNSAAADQ